MITERQFRKWAGYLRWSHEPLAGDQGQASFGGPFADWLEHQAPIWRIAPCVGTSWLARLRFCIPRRRRNRPPPALANCQANWFDSGGPLALVEHQLEQEQIREFGQLRSEVTDKLRQHAYIDDQNARHVFQYMILPSFTPPIAWDVFRRRRIGSPNEHVLLRTSWRSDIDLEKLRTPVERLRRPYPLVPTIEVHELPAHSGELEALAEELAEIELPIGASVGSVGCDGSTFEVAVEQPPHGLGSASCRLSWWCELPAAWGGLGLWLRQAEIVFDTAWSARGDNGSVPSRIRVIDDASARQQAHRLFHEHHYGRVVELLVDIASREQLTPAETKMLELALKRVGGSRG